MAKRLAVGVLLSVFLALPAWAGTDAVALPASPRADGPLASGAMMKTACIIASDNAWGFDYVGGVSIDSMECLYKRIEALEKRLKNLQKMMQSLGSVPTYLLNPYLLNPVRREPADDEQIRQNYERGQKLSCQSRPDCIWMGD